eukprot:jgi/Astpho2/8115/Aster-03056
MLRPGILAGFAGDRTLAVLIGNTKHIWRPFLEACSWDPSLLEAENPLEAYVERTVTAIVDSALQGLTYRCFWSHTESDGLSSGRRAPYQQLAHAIGLAHLDESTNLCLHPKYGPWWALRCLVVFDGVEWNGARKPVLPNPLHPPTQQLIKMTMRAARQPSGDWGTAEGSPSSTSSPAPIPSAAQQISAASSIGSDESLRRRSGSLTRSSSGRSRSLPLTAEQVAANWRKWVAVRDLPCPGHPWRYCKDQLEAHYRRDKLLLHHAVVVAKSASS